MKRAIAAAVIVLGLASCSNSIDNEPQGDGTCEQTTEHKFFGVTYSTDRNVLNCDNEGE